MKIKRLFIFLVIILLLSLFAYFKQTGFSIKQEKIQARVVDVIDGDTIKVIFENKEDKNNEEINNLRLLGINTPEKNMPLHQEAKQFLMYVNGSIVELEFDKEKKDRYDRYLAYVFYQDEFINKEILQNGLATTYMYSDLKYKKHLIEAEDYARKNQLGLWQKSDNACTRCMEIEIYNGADKDDCQPGIEYVKIINLCDFNCDMQDWTLKDEANHIYTFDNVLRASSFIILYSGVGEDTKTSLYWQNKGCSAIWNDDGDSAFLRDKEGGLIIYESY